MLKEAVDGLFGLEAALLWKIVGYDSLGDPGPHDRSRRE